MKPMTRQLPPAAQSYTGDQGLLAATLMLLAFGLVMMTSASIEIAASQYGDAFYHLKRQLRFMLMGLIAAAVVLNTPLRLWRKFSLLLYGGTLLLLILVLVPGVGQTVNGSSRWLSLGVMSVQVSELAKLLVVVFLADFVSRYRDWVKQDLSGFLCCLAFVAPVAVLLLLEPDFGAVVVLMLAVFGMLFLAGVKLHHLLLVMVLAIAAMAAMLFSASYRIARIESFLQALANPFHEDVVFGSGYQLAQALIGFGRGEWLGIGLGNSIQKMYFLPEAHTDFVLAIIAEELGFIMVLALLVLFAYFLYRAVRIARRNEKAGHYFAAYLAYGLTLLFSGQILINVAVNVGMAPTKGLTLPFMSYGGSSLIVCLLMVALLLRIDIEHHERIYNRLLKARQAY